jgi:hypothetical protein
VLVVLVSVAGCGVPRGDVAGLRLALAAECAHLVTLGVDVYSGTQCFGTTVLSGKPLDSATIAANSQQPVRIAAGQHSLVVNGYDASGTLTCRGCSDVLVERGVTKDVPVSMQPLSGPALTPGLSCDAPFVLTSGVAYDGTLTPALGNDHHGTCAMPDGYDWTGSLSIDPGSRVRVAVDSAAPFALELDHPHCVDGPVQPCVVAQQDPKDNRYYAVIDVAQLGADLTDTSNAFIVVDAMTSGAGQPFHLLAERLDGIPQPPPDQCDGTMPVAPNADPTPGDLSTELDDWNVSCVPYGTDRADRAYNFNLDGSMAALVEVRAPGWPAALDVLAGSCTSPSAHIGCTVSGADNRYLYIGHPAAGEYSAIVESASGVVGPYSIQVQTGPLISGFSYWIVRESVPYEPIVGGAKVSNSLPTSNPASVEDVNYLFDISAASDPAKPFGIPYWGAKQFQMYVGTNGAVSFLPGEANQPGGGLCPLDSVTDAMVALMWEDFTAKPTSNIIYKVEGTAPERRLRIEFIDWDFRCNSGPCGYSHTEQIILHESGLIMFHYGPRTEPSSPPTGALCPDNNAHRDEGCYASMGLSFQNKTSKLFCHDDLMSPYKAVADARYVFVPSN